MMEFILNYFFLSVITALFFYWLASPSAIEEDIRDSKNSSLKQEKSDVRSNQHGEDRHQTDTESRRLDGSTFRDEGEPQAQTSHDFETPQVPETQGEVYFIVGSTQHTQNIVDEEKLRVLTREDSATREDESCRGEHNNLHVDAVPSTNEPKAVVLEPLLPDIDSSVVNSFVREISLKSTRTTSEPVEWAINDVIRDVGTIKSCPMTSNVLESTSQTCSLLHDQYFSSGVPEPCMVDTVHLENGSVIDDVVAKASDVTKCAEKIEDHNICSTGVFCEQNVFSVLDPDSCATCEGNAVGGTFTSSVECSTELKDTQTIETTLMNNNIDAILTRVSSEQLQNDSESKVFDIEDLTNPTETEWFKVSTAERLSNENVSGSEQKAVVSVLTKETSTTGTYLDMGDSAVDHFTQVDSCQLHGDPVVSYVNSQDVMSHLLQETDPNSLAAACAVEVAKSTSTDSCHQNGFAVQEHRDESTRVSLEPQAEKCHWESDALDGSSTLILSDKKKESIFSEHLYDRESIPQKALKEDTTHVLCNSEGLGIIDTELGCRSAQKDEYVDIPGSSLEEEEEEACISSLRPTRDPQHASGVETEKNELGTEHPQEESMATTPQDDQMTLDPESPKEEFNVKRVLRHIKRKALKRFDRVLRCDTPTDTRNDNRAQQPRHAFDMDMFEQSSDESFETSDTYDSDMEREPCVDLNTEVDRVEYLKKDGNELFKERAYLDAAKSYTEALKVVATPEMCAVLLCNRAACYLLLKKYKDVVADCNDGLSLDPSYMKLYLRRFRAYEGLEKWHEALADLNKTLEMDPSLCPTYEVLHSKIKAKSEEQFEKEKEEMLNKLKGFGNWALGKIGLSIDNFKVEQNQETGAYNISFQNAP